MTENNGWTETDSEIYQRLSQVAVPARAEQIAALLTLIPFAPTDTFHVVELASGEGLLSAAVMHAFPNATLLALDGSEAMRQATRARLAGFSDKVSVGDFDMAADDWYDHLDGADVVMSSLCVHHLNGTEKRGLFQAIAERLSTRGVLLIADLIEPQRNEGRELFAGTWDAAAQAQSQVVAESSELYDLFRAENWNYYRTPDPLDKPSSLFEQLLWLRDAGFAVADCFWMQAGHAIYGGYKSTTSVSASLSYPTAVTVAEQVLQSQT